MNDIKVHQHGESASKARQAFFSVDDLKVSVSSWDSGRNDDCMKLATDLSDRAKLRSRIDELEAMLAASQEETANARSRIPPKSPARLLGGGVVRVDDKGFPWVMNKEATGWSSFGVRCDGWEDLFRRFDIRITSHGSDGFSAFWRFEVAA